MVIVQNTRVCARACSEYKTQRRISVQSEAYVYMRATNMEIHCLVLVSLSLFLRQGGSHVIRPHGRPTEVMSIGTNATDCHYRKGPI
jgi:hypothetical protein